MIFDTLQMVLWSAAYCMIIVASVVESWKSSSYHPAMPYLPGALNLAWEINAVIVNWPLWGNIVWLFLDSVIVFLNLRGLKRNKERLCWLALSLLLTVLLRAVFLIQRGILLSSFLIDLLIAAVYVVRARYVSQVLRTWVGLLKLLGDFFAWLAYREYSDLVDVMGIIVLVLNVYYMAYSLELDSQRTRKNQNHRK